MATDPVAQQVQFALAVLQQALAAVQFVDAPPDDVAEALDLLSKVSRLELVANAVELGAPTLSASRPTTAQAVAPWPAQAVSRK